MASYERKCREGDAKLYAKYLRFRKSLAKTWLAKTLKVGYDFDLVIWVDYLLRFNEQDAKRHLILGVLFAPMIACFITKTWFQKDAYPEEMYVFYFCWIIFLTYEYINYIWLSKLDVEWFKQSSEDYKALFNDYRNLWSNYNFLKKQHTLSKKQVQYLKSCLTSRGIKVNTAFISKDDFLEEKDPKLNEMTANSSQKEESQTNENMRSSSGKEEVTVSAASETANIPSNPSVSNPTIVVNQAANSGGTDPNDDTESVKFVAESESVQFSAGCKTNELAGDELKAEQDFKCDWEIVDEIIQ